MSDAHFEEENCENCVFLTDEDRCGNPQSVYHGRPTVYRDEDGAVDQTGWCDQWTGRVT